MPSPGLCPHLGWLELPGPPALYNCQGWQGQAARAEVSQDQYLLETVPNGSLPGATDVPVALLGPRLGGKAWFLSVIF